MFGYRKTSDKLFWVKSLTDGVTEQTIISEARIVQQKNSTNAYTLLHENIVVHQITRNKLMRSQINANSEIGFQTWC